MRFFTPFPVPAPLALGLALFAASASAAPFAAPAIMSKSSPASHATSFTVTATGLAPGNRIPDANAFCIPDARQHSTPGGQNQNIGLAWHEAPFGTQSYALIATDPDVPGRFDDAGKEGKTLAADMPRQTFTHWLIFDIPASVGAIPANLDPQTAARYGIIGENDLGAYHAKNPNSGVHAGYDGPCPPWNDARIHHYHFRVYALNVKTLGLKANAKKPEVEAALTPHILAQGEVVGTYSLNPDAKE